MDDEQFMQLLQSAAGEYRRIVQERSSSDPSTAPQSFEHQFRPYYDLFPEQDIRSRSVASRASSPRTARRESWLMVAGRAWVQLLLSVVFLSGPTCLLLELAILLSKTVANPASSRSTYLYRAAELLTRWDEAFGVSPSSSR